VSQVATYAYVNPLVAVVLGWALLDETLGLGTLAGAALVVVSVAATVTRESTAKRRASLHHATKLDRVSFVRQRS
jgi:drug/metabolite transporter (DMT)-like permease